MWFPDTLSYMSVTCRFHVNTPWSSFAFFAKIPCRVAMSFLVVDGQTLGEFDWREHARQYFSSKCVIVQMPLSFN